jgi:ATP:ADP antiporter, AAA family
LVTGFWLLFGLTDATWPAIAFMVSIELLWLLTNLEFWSLSVRIFNIQQGKRLFGVIGSGDTIASIVGGFTVPVFVSILGTQNLLLFVIASIIASLVVILVIARSYGERLSVERQAVERPEVIDRYANPLKNRYLVLIFAFAGVATISYYFLDNAFYGLAEIQFVESDSLTSFLGIYFAVMALVQLIVQTFFTARIINRLGIAACIILVPLVGTVMMLFTTGVALVAGTALITFMVMAAVRLIEYVIRVTLIDTSQMTIYQSLPPTVRVQTQTQVESFVEPVLTGVTGIALLLIFDILGGNLVHVIILSAFVGLGWTVVAVLLSREYPKALIQALSKRRLGNMTYLVKEQSISALIKTRLVDSNTGDALYLIDLLQETDPAALPTLLPQLLNHSAVDVRRDVLRRIESLNLTSASSGVQKLLAQVCKNCWKPNRMLKYELLHCAPFLLSIPSQF